MTKKEIKTIFGFGSAAWQKAIIDDYKDMYNYVKEITNSFPYSFNIDIQNSTRDEHVIKVEYKTGINTGGSSVFVLPVGNAYYAAMLAMLQSGKNLLTKKAA